MLAVDGKKNSSSTVQIRSVLLSIVDIDIDEVPMLSDYSAAPLDWHHATHCTHPALDQWISTCVGQEDPPMVHT